MTDEAEVQEAPETPEVAEEVQESPAKEWAPEVEEQARLLGWKHPDEWQGEKPAGMIERPDEFMDRAQSILPFRKLNEQFEKLKGDFDKRLGGIESVYSKALERQKAQAKQQIEALQARQMKAFDEGDKETFEAARQAEEQLRSQVAAEPDPPKPAEIPADVRAALDSWRVDNDWFGADAEKTQAASAAWTDAEKMGLTNPQAILKFVDKKLAEKYPAKPEARKTSAFEDGALTLGGGADEFTKLPKDAKDAFKKMVGQGLFEDTKAGRAQYVKDYNDA